MNTDISPWSQETILETFPEVASSLHGPRSEGTSEERERGTRRLHTWAHYSCNYCERNRSNNREPEKNNVLVKW